MITEALAWSKGTLANPHKHLIVQLHNGLDVYFLKPGKEVSNTTRPNPHDMTPLVGDSSYTPRFDEIWTTLAKISLKDFDCFNAALVLVYRNAYLIDHVEANQGLLRYQPNNRILEVIETIETKVGNVEPFGLLGLMHFLNNLGLNEDVKYHVENHKPTFSGKYKNNVGRINTLLTCIRVPYQAATFIKEARDAALADEEIDFMNLFTIMQQFAKSRGTCTPTQKQLRDWLSPIIN